MLRLKFFWNFYWKIGKYPISKIKIFGKKGRNLEIPPNSEKKIFGKIYRKLKIFYVSYKMENEIIEKYLNKEFGSYKITKYLGYYANGNQKYKRHYFEKECKFCGNLTFNPPGQLSALMKRDDICCNYCKGSINIHTNEKKCSDCQKWLPATNEYYPLSKNRPFGIHYYCFVCHTKRGRKHRENPENRKREYEHKKQRMETDLIFKLSCRLKSNIKMYVKRIGVKGTGRKHSKSAMVDILGCDYEFFKRWIEDKFTEGMSWDNYGKWHYEHLIPTSYAKTVDELYELCHHTNYRPMWGGENLSKGNKLYINEIPEKNKVRYKKFIDRYIDSDLVRYT